MIFLLKNIKLETCDSQNIHLIKQIEKLQKLKLMKREERESIQGQSLRQLEREFK